MKERKKSAQIAGEIKKQRKNKTQQSTRRYYLEANCLHKEHRYQYFLCYYQCWCNFFAAF